MELLRVASKSNPNSVAGMMAVQFREGAERVELQAIGAGATNQALKAVAIVRGFMAPSGVDLVCIPVFSEIQMDGMDRTALKLIVKKV